MMDYDVIKFLISDFIIQRSPGHCVQSTNQVILLSYQCHTVNIKVEGKSLEEVDNFTYLGSGVGTTGRRGHKSKDR